MRGSLGAAEADFRGLPRGLGAGALAGSSASTGVCSLGVDAGAERRFERRDAGRQLLEPRDDALARRGRCFGSGAAGVDPFLDPLSDEVARPHAGLAGEVLQRVYPSRIQAERHCALVGRALESRSRGEGPVAAAARLVGTVPAATWLIWAVRSAARLVRTIRAIAAGALARLPVAATLRGTVGSIGPVAIGSVGSAVWAASVETHRFQR